MNFPYIFLVCSIIVELCFAQSEENNKMNNYLRDMQDEVWQKVRNYGLSNLPDVDINVYYNITDGIGYDIQGTLYLWDGFVMDIGDIVFIHEGKTRFVIGYPKGTNSIETYIGFERLSFFRDFRFEADEAEKILDQAIGGVIIKPEEFYFDIKIVHDLMKDTVKCTMSSVLQGKATKNSLDFYPKNTLTARLKNNLSYSVRIFDKIGESWQSVFEPILNEVVKSMPFPRVSQ